MRHLIPPLLALAACTAAAPPATPGFKTETLADFDSPWAMTFLPGGKFLVTEKAGKLLLVSADAKTRIEVAGVPPVDAAGQGGLGDVVLHPDFRNERYVYLSWAEPSPDGTSGAAVGRGKLVESGGAAKLDGWQVIWRQEPKVTGKGHYGHRMAFGPDGMLYITSSDRQKQAPAQDLNQNLGKVIRLSPAGGIPSDNPFYDQGRVKAQIWSYGHRNLLGIAFDAKGNLWQQEMGPQGGDEVNLVLKGRNYGYPLASNGRNYNAPTDDLPDHRPGDGFEAPKVWWDPVISPGGLIVYSGKLWPKWRGDLFIGGLSSEALVRVDVDGTNVKKGDQWPMGTRIREVEEAPDGSLWLLEDGTRGAQGRLMRLTPAG